MPTEGDQIQFNGSLAGYPSLVQDGTSATVVNFPNGPWPAAAYLVAYSTGAYAYAIENSYWTAGSTHTGTSPQGSTNLTDSASNTVNCGPIITGQPYLSQALVQSATAMVDNATYWVQSGSGPIGIWTHDNPYTDNQNGTPSPTYYLIPYWPQGLSVTLSGTTTPCGLVASSAGLTWTATTGSSSYKIYRSTTSGSGYTLVGTSATNSYTDSTVASNTEYYYVVTAIVNTFESPYSSEANTGAAVLPTATPNVLTDAVAWFTSLP